jgi:hypothetical protein
LGWGWGGCECVFGQVMRRLLWAEERGRRLEAAEGACWLDGLVLGWRVVMRDALVSA